MDTVVFTVCRMNPPTKGHEKLVKRVLSESKKLECASRVFLTRSHDNKKNPLVVEQKLQFAKEFFPGIDIVDTMNVFSACREMAKEGFKHGILVVGKDRENAFDTALNKYINHPDPEKDIGLESIQVIVIPRSIHDFSATAVRDLAFKGDFHKFQKSIPASNLAVAHEMYKCVRQGLGVKNE
jgi:citrate lyase synthetase